MSMTPMRLGASRKFAKSDAVTVTTCVPPGGAVATTAGVGAIAVPSDVATTRAVASAAGGRAGEVRAGATAVEIGVGVAAVTAGVSTRNGVAMAVLVG